MKQEGGGKHVRREDVTRELAAAHPEGEQRTEENFHRVSEERKILRRTLKEVPRHGAIADAVASELAATDARAKQFSIQKLGGFSPAKQRLQKDKETAEQSAWLDEEAVRQELGPPYDELAAHTSQLEELHDFLLRSMREAKHDPHARTVHAKLLATVRGEIETLERSIAAVREQSPVIARAFELASYQRGLHEEGHIAPVPSVAQALHEIGIRMVSGRPMFLHG